MTLIIGNDNMGLVKRYTPNIRIIKDVKIKSSGELVMIVSKEPIKDERDMWRAHDEFLFCWRDVKEIDVKAGGGIQDLIEVEVIKMLPGNAYRQIVHKQYKKEEWAACLNYVMEAVGKEKYSHKTM
jgi:hypothetical protein